MESLNSTASRLIYKALSLNASPSSDAEYRELLAKYRANPDMQKALLDIATGMELIILDVSERGIFIAPTGKESRFSIRLGNLRATLNEDQRVSLALSFLTICAVFFPTTTLIEDDSRFPMPATLDTFTKTLRSLVDRMKAQEDADDYSREELRPAWSYIYGMRDKIPESTRASPGTIEGLIRMALNYMGDYGLVNGSGVNDEDDAVEYTATHRLRVQLRERTLPRLFEYVRNQVTE